MIRRLTQLVVLALLTIGARAQDLPVVNKSFLQDSLKIAAGYQDGGLGATAKGDYVTAFGHIRNNFTPGFTYGVDGNWNSRTGKPDQIEFSGGVGLVEVNPGFPRWSAFARLLGKNGEFEKDKTIHKVNQILAGATVEYVPSLFSDWVLKRVTMPVDEFDASDPCYQLTAPQRAKHPECKVKVVRTLEAPPKFTLSYYHPIRTRGDVDLPEKIDAGKFTTTLEADNTVLNTTSVPLRIVANLSATYPTRGADKKLKGKIDVGVGFPSVSEKFTPMVKYVSGEKDGFKYERAIIVGVLFDFAKTFLHE